MRPFAALVSNLPKALAARGLPLASRSVRNRATLASRAFSSAGAATYIAFENDDEQAFGNYLQENDKVVAYFTASWWYVHVSCSYIIITDSCRQITSSILFLMQPPLSYDG